MSSTVLESFDLLVERYTLGFFSHSFRDRFETVFMHDYYGSIEHSGPEPAKFDAII